MKKSAKSRIMILFLSAVLVLGCFCAGCSLNTSGMSDADELADGFYRIYYVNSEGTALIRKNYKAVSTDFEGILEELLNTFMTTESTQYRSALPEGVKINSVTPVISEIDVDFNAEYLSLDSINETLLRAALVNTLLQLRGVDTVRFTVESQSLVVNDQEVGAMTDETFIVPTGNSINSYRNEILTLYFPNADGSKLIQEIRTIYYSTNVNTKRMTVEQLISGPKNPNLITVTTPNVLVNSIVVDHGICTVDFSQEVNGSPFADNPTDPETVLYAFANSIIDSCEDEKIEGVRFLIDGSMDTRFRGEVNLDQTFLRNSELIDTSGASVPKQGFVIDQQLEPSVSGNEQAVPLENGDQSVMMEQEITEDVN